MHLWLCRPQVQSTWSYWHSSGLPSRERETLSTCGLPKPTAAYSHGPAWLHTADDQPLQQNYSTKHHHLRQADFSSSGQRSLLLFILHQVDRLHPTNHRRTTACPTAVHSHALTTHKHKLTYNNMPCARWPELSQIRDLGGQQTGGTGKAPCARDTSAQQAAD